MVKIVTTNKRAYHRFRVLETLEAGIELKGPEIKSIRMGRVSLGSSYVKIIGEEAYVLGMRIDPYPKAPRDAFDPQRKRKLLLRRSQIARLVGIDARKGFTIVPLKMYLKSGLAKLELGICKGKTRRDRREELKEQAMQRDAERAMKDELKK
ncbi:MAG: SsrA-binding protein SmpB [Patescibacteria group bacterium]|nr:SsrA-binding protein SmpB [Patescibacteria group bacterium]